MLNFVETENTMKTLSLKLDEDIFLETEFISDQLNLARNRYINEALNLYNKYQKKKLLKAKLAAESKAVSADSMAILKEFESLVDAD